MLMQDMTEQQKSIFMSEVNNGREDATTAVLLGVFLGAFGAHHFYMGNTGLGILYLLFFWTFIPSTVTLIELFLLSDRVKNYNNAKAIEIASGVKAMFPQK